MPSPDSLVFGTLPRPSPRRLAIRVSRDAERQIRAGHPWVFDRAIRSVNREGSAGDLGVVFDHRDRFVAIGLWDPHSPVRLRVLQVGSPRVIDASFWHARISAALDRRSPLAASSFTTGYRCIHGENDALPGLVVDRYDDKLVIKLYSEAWIPHLSAFVPVLAATSRPRSIVLRLARRVAAPAALRDGMTVAGEPVAGAVHYLENGIAMEADLVRGQKTGAFLDQRDNRHRLRASSEGARVLDVFACTGGFSVSAAAGGAALVHSVDQSRHAIDAARRTMKRQFGDGPDTQCRHLTTVGDAFEVLPALADKGDRYDIVVVDPPSFASNVASVPAALSAYRTLTTGALRLLRPGGLLVQASCSSRVDASTFFETIHRAARSSGHELHEVARTAHPLDHPIGFPQGAYLKALFARTGRAEPARGGRSPERHTGATPGV